MWLEISSPNQKNQLYLSVQFPIFFLSQKNAFKCIPLVSAGWCGGHEKHVWLLYNPPINLWSHILFQVSQFPLKWKLQISPALFCLFCLGCLRNQAEEAAQPPQLCLQKHDLGLAKRQKLPAGMKSFCFELDSSKRHSTQGMSRPRRAPRTLGSQSSEVGLRWGCGVRHNLWKLCSPR